MINIPRFIFFSVIGFLYGSIVNWNISPEPSKYHTSTIPGSSGDLICGSSCKIKD